MKMLHWKSVVSLVVLACFLAAGKCQSGVACPSLVGKPGCVCNHPDGKGIIDLTSIANEASAGPRFAEYDNKKIICLGHLSFHSGFQAWKIYMDTPIHTIPALPTARVFAVMFMYVAQLLCRRLLSMLCSAGVPNIFLQS